MTILVMFIIGATGGGATVHAVNKSEDSSKAIVREYKPKQKKKKNPTLFGFEIKPVKKVR